MKLKSNLSIGSLVTSSTERRRISMKHRIINALFALMLLISNTSASFAHGGGSRRPTLHVNPKWKECSFQLDPSLTQKAWHQFTEEAGLVTYFRAMTDARPMGVWKFELSAVQWKTGIDNSDDAWNNTFVHPDSTHWLSEKSGLKFPGLIFRLGVTDKIDVGGYFTKNPDANYGFWGGQIQYNLIHEAKNDWDVAARASVVSLFGPKDLDFSVYGLDLLTSKKLVVRKWASLSPYAGVSTYFANSHEKTSAVHLGDEHILGLMGTVGTVAQISVARIAAEYNIAKVNSFSIKVGVSF